MLVFVVLKRVKYDYFTRVKYCLPPSQSAFLWTKTPVSNTTRLATKITLHLLLCCLFHAAFSRYHFDLLQQSLNNYPNIQNSKTGSVELETGSAGPETWHHVQRAQTRAKRTQPSSASAQRKQREIWWTSTAGMPFFFSLPCWTRRMMNMRLILSAFCLYNEQNKPQREWGRTRAQWKRYWTLLSELAAHTANRPRFVVKKTEIHTSYPMKK